MNPLVKTFIFAACVVSVIAIIGWFGANSHADVLDELHKLPHQQQCIENASLFRAGMFVHNHQVSREEAVEYSANPDAWKNLSERDKEHYAKYLLLGWDKAEYMVKEFLKKKQSEEPEFSGKATAFLSQDAILVETQNFINFCVASSSEENEVSLDGHFTKVASSQHLQDIRNMYMRHEGCKQNLPVYLDKCKQSGGSDRDCYAESLFKYEACLAIPCRNASSN